MSERLNIFMSYAKQDYGLLKELENHLAPLREQGLISTWSDTEVNAGIEWEKKLHEHLESADIILLLISSDFIASKYSNISEVQHIMNRHESGNARVIPVLLRPVDSEGAQFNSLRTLPNNAIPVTNWINRDEAFTNITRGLRKVIGEIQASRRLPQQQEKRFSVAQMEQLTGNPLVQLKKMLPELFLQKAPNEPATSPHSFFIYSGHTSPIYTIAWSPDGAFIASGDQNGTVHAWKSDTGERMLSATPWGKKSVQHIRWSPDNQYIAVRIGNKDSSRVFIWHVETQKPVHCAGYLYLPYSHTSCFDWSPDSTYIVMDDKMLHTKAKIGIWKIDTREHVVDFTRHTHDSIVSIAWSPTKTEIASRDAEGEVRIWDSSGQTNSYYQAYASRMNEKAIWSPDGKNIAFSSNDKAIQIRSSSRNRIVATYPITGSVDWIRWLHEGASLAFVYGTNKQHCTIWDFKANRILFAAPDHGHLSADSRYFASIADDTSIQVQSIETADVAYTYRDHSTKISCFAWSPDGQYIASGSLDYTIHVWPIKV